jgi:TonB-linked SusC/RagA family outer membrane protein
MKRMWMSVLWSLLVLHPGSEVESQQQEPIVTATRNVSSHSIRRSLFTGPSAARAPVAAPQIPMSTRTGTVSGRVTDAVSQQPLAGASVVVVGTQLGVVAGADGRFVLANVPPGNQRVRASLIGYAAVEQAVEVTTGETSTVELALSPQAVVLEEIIAVGYGTQQKAHLTAAVDQITGEALQNRPLANLTQGLQGVLPNVNIRLLDGKPTQAPQINVRGTTSIGQGGNALVLIDGVEGDPSLLNPNDIETITVLKDASSAAVYGARGAFGVLLITTKQPTREGFSITYGANYGLRQPTVPTDFVTDGYTWGSKFNESFFNWEGSLPQNVNKTMVFSQEYLAELERRANDPSLPRVEVGPDGRYVYYESTDWFDLLYKDNTPTMEHNLSMSRSTDNTSFMLSGRYLNQDGLFRYSSDDYRLLNLRAAGTLQLYPWLEMRNNFSIANRKYYNPLNVGEGGGIWRNLADEGHPLSPMLNPDGSLTHSAAYTVGDFYYGKNGMDFEWGTLRNTTSFTSDFFDETLQLHGDFSFQHSTDGETRRRVQIPYSRAPGVMEWLGTQYNDLRETNDETVYLAGNLYGDLQKQFGDRHFVNVVLGTNYEQSTAEELEVQRNGLIFADASNINLALGQSIITGGDYEKWNILGGFYRFNYIFDDRYLLELNGRYDGSSKFPSDERYAFFPSVSFGWRLSNEPFWKISPSFISELKFRGSYGSMGNGNIGAYAFHDIFDISQTSRILNGLQPRQTSRPSVLPDGLTWETVTTRNAGIDLEMLDGRLQFTGDAYVRETSDMYTIGRTLPAIFGATSPRGNYADLKTTGWEAMLVWRDQLNLGPRPLGYDLRLTLADHTAEILEYNNPDKFLNDYYAGMKIGEMWGFITEGFFTSEEEIAAHADQSLYRSHSSGLIQVGDIKLKDVNGDGQIDTGDNTVENPGDRVIIGNSAPRYRFGVNLGADYGNFFISSFFQGVGKQDWYPIAESNVFWGQYNRPYGDIPSWHLDEGMVWSPENPNSFFPRYAARLANRSEGILRQAQSKYVMNAAYVRLKNFQIGYNLPARLTSRLGSSAARIYFSGDNLWTWSPLYQTANNIDVENATAPSDQLFTSGNAGDGYNYPMLKSFTMGVSVTF